MNRTDRLLGVLLELQRCKRVRAEDLAALFETSKRTIYRDIQALCETGVPIIAQAGQGYSLVEGYFLPPLSFSVAVFPQVLKAGFIVGGRGGRGVASCRTAKSYGTYQATSILEYAGSLLRA